MERERRESSEVRNRNVPSLKGSRGEGIWPRVSGRTTKVGYVRSDGVPSEGTNGFYNK